MKRKTALVALLMVALLIMRLPIAVYADGGIEDMPGVGSLSIIYEDNAPAVWVGGNFTADPGFAETEGLTVIQGNMIVHSNPLLGIGVVGVGSGIIPTPDSVMLAVGGDLTASAGSKVKIGAPLDGLDKTISALALIGGDISGDVKAVYSDGIEDTRNIFSGLGATATSLWSSFETELKYESDKLAKMAPTGSVSSLWGVIEFASWDDAAPLQVFEVSAEDLTGFVEYGEFRFFNTGTLENGRFTPIVINVIGENANLFQNSVYFDGELVNAFTSSDYGNAASAILWNFVDAKTLDIPGTSQVMGTIITPYTETVTITAHTNGRLFVNGDLTRSGTNTEHHNYPWTGGGWYFESSDEPLWCIPEDTGDPEVIEEPGDPEVIEEPGDPEVIEEPGDPEVIEEPGDPEIIEEPGDPEYLEELDDPEYLEEPGEPEVSEGPGDPVTPGDPVGPGDHGKQEDPVDSSTGYPASMHEYGDPTDQEAPSTISPARWIVADDPVDSRSGYAAGTHEYDNPVEVESTEYLEDLDEPGSEYAAANLSLPNTGIYSHITQLLIMMCCAAALSIFSVLLWHKAKARRL